MLSPNTHMSDCGTNNEPAFKNTECDCVAANLMHNLQIILNVEDKGEVALEMWESLDKEVARLRQVANPLVDA